MNTPFQYLGARSDLLNLVEGMDGAVLDVGCAAGATGIEIKRRWPGCTITGIERDERLTRRARLVLDEIINGDAEKCLDALLMAGRTFDHVVCGDILEHLVDPWAALTQIRRLCPNGSVLVSLPNIAHISSLWSVAVLEYWPYREAGLHDRTHLRFFARKNLRELFEGAGFASMRITARYRVIDGPHILNRLLEGPISRIPGIRRLLCYQFLITLM